MGYETFQPFSKEQQMEHHLGGKIYNHPHGAPFGLSLQLPFFHIYPSIFRTTRKRFNLYGILLNAIIPWLLFSVTMGIFSFSIYYNDPWEAVLYTIGLFVLTVGGSSCCMWIAKIRAEREEEDEDEVGPLWFFFLFVCSTVAIILGITLGLHNQGASMRKVYDYDSLQTYHDIDPGDYLGTQLVDAGRILFNTSAHLDLRYSIGFKDEDVYCVAPIVSPKFRHYSTFDFWVVGKNCCSGVAADFHCKGFNDGQIHGGLRLMDEDARVFYRLAVQQAEATYWINTHKPLFFEWIEDPIKTVEDMKHKGLFTYVSSVIAALIFQFVLITVTVLVFAKMFPMRGEDHSSAFVM